MLTPEELEAGSAAAAAAPPVRFQNDPVTPAIQRSLKLRPAPPGSPRGAEASGSSSPAAAADGDGALQPPRPGPPPPAPARRALAAAQAELCARIMAAQDEAGLRRICAAEAALAGKEQGAGALLAGVASSSAAGR